MSNPRPDDGELEDKLRLVMAALRNNKLHTGTDVWPGKPEQEPLPVAAEADDECELLETGGQDEIGKLMTTYVNSLSVLRRNDKQPEPAPTASGPGATGPQGEPQYSNMSMGELLAALDDMS